jgi:hypothetical protein
MEFGVETGSKNTSQAAGIEVSGSKKISHENFFLDKEVFLCLNFLKSNWK